MTINPAFDGDGRQMKSKRRPSAGRGLAPNRLEKTRSGELKMRNEFLSIASHELRTPLTSLQLQLENLHLLVTREGAAAIGAGLADGLKAAIRQTQRLDKLMDGLLNLSRMTTGRFELIFEEFDLTLEAREIVSRLSEQATRVGCELRFHAGSPSVGLWDGPRIEQALMNLISNATRYAPGNPIDVTVNATGDDVFISVEDRGMGIGPQDLARIFKLFERAVPSEHYGGLGLGLFLTQQIVEACGGSIDVASELGKGSLFRIRLPIRRQASLPDVCPSPTVPKRLNDEPS